MELGGEGFPGLSLGLRPTPLGMPPFIVPLVEPLEMGGVARPRFGGTAGEYGEVLSMD